MRIVYKDIVKKQAVFEAKVEEKFTSFLELQAGYQKRTEEVIIAMKADQKGLEQFIEKTIQKKLNAALKSVFADEMNKMKANLTSET